MAARKKPQTFGEPDPEAALRTAPKLLRLALGSDSQNERHVAVDRLHALMVKNRLSADDVLDALAPVVIEGFERTAQVVREVASDPNVQKVAVNIGDLFKSGAAVVDRFRQARRK
jgi:hypothetical protein